MKAHPVTSPTLLILLRDIGNQSAWNQFVQIYAPLIYGYCCQKGLQAADASDVSQEVLLSVCRSIHDFDYDGSKGRFRTWLWRVTRSKLCDYFRELSRHQAIFPPTSQCHELDSDVEETHPDEWDREYRCSLFNWAASKVREEVTETTWNAFFATTLQERCSHEVASSLGMSVGAVYIAKSRVLARLKQIMASVEQHGPELVSKLVR